MVYARHINHVADFFYESHRNTKTDPYFHAVICFLPATNESIERIIMYEIYALAIT